MMNVLVCIRVNGERSLLPLPLAGKGWRGGRVLLSGGAGAPTRRTSAREGAAGCVDLTRKRER
jgi:hypothetical protein